MICSCCAAAIEDVARVIYRVNSFATIATCEPCYDHCRVSAECRIGVSDEEFEIYRQKIINGS